MNRYVGNLAPMPGMFPDYCSRRQEHRCGARNGLDALGHAAAKAPYARAGH
jgi:hypothetical protein